MQISDDSLAAHSVIYYILMGKNLTGFRMSGFGISIVVLVLVDNLDQSLCQVRYVTSHREPNFMASFIFPIGIDDVNVSLAVRFSTVTDFDVFE